MFEQTFSLEKLKRIRRTGSHPEGRARLAYG